MLIYCAGPGYWLPKKALRSASCWPQSWSVWFRMTSFGAGHESRLWLPWIRASTSAALALTGSRCMSARFVDTNILIYAHDVDAGDRHWRARNVVSELWESGLGMVSTQVLHEFYVNITRKIPSPVAPATARALIEPYLSWQVQELGPGSVLVASEIQQRYRISFWDALIIHAAARGGAVELYSEDLNAGQIMEGVRIVNPLVDPGIHESSPVDLDG